MKHSPIRRKQSCDHASCRGSTICRHGNRLRRKQPPRTRTALPKRNPERRDREWARAYGSEVRVEFVKALPCCVPGCRNRAENAHTESGGMGRKADADTIAPLCY
ncbi:MAG TPA: hypothetical protein VK966_08125, partial [Longimicrobiales bacterium]|nr:hypothetical protein [Longimicrobiales bacterium]